MDFDFSWWDDVKNSVSSAWNSVTGNDPTSGGYNPQDYMDAHVDGVVNNSSMWDRATDSVGNALSGAGDWIEDHPNTSAMAVQLGTPIIAGAIARRNQPEPVKLDAPKVAEVAPAGPQYAQGVSDSMLMQQGQDFLPGTAESAIPERKSKRKPTSMQVGPIASPY